jgi:hypothetical protein
LFIMPPLDFCIFTHVFIWHNAKVQGWHDKQKSIKNASTRLRMTWRVII